MTLDATQVPDGWRVARLGEVLKLEYGVPLPERERLPGAIPVVGSAGVVGLHDHATNAGPGVVVGRKGSIGTVTWVPTDFVPIDTTYYSVPVGEQADLRWIYHVLTREDLARLNRATGVPGLSRDDVYALRRLLPPLPEQRAIAAVLDGIDEAIERTEEVIAATERLRDALLHELLTRGLPGRHSEWVDVPGLGTVPACWDLVRLGEAGRWLSGGTPPKARSDYWVGTLPWVSPKDMKVREIREAEDHITDEAARAGSRVVPPGTLLVVVRGMILAHSFPMAVTRATVAFNQDIRALICRDGLLPDFVLAGMEHQKARLLHLPTPSTHGTMRVESEELFSVQLPTPPLDEQRAITAALEGVEGNAERAREERARLQSLQASAADALLTGRVRVSHSER